MMRRPGRAEFPDCVTARGARHLDDLAAEVARGARAVMVYLVQIGSAESVAFARDIDPAYGAAFDRARAAGVEAVALACRISPEGIEAERAIPVLG
jgi:sugar fermentation stimulation protein A